MKRNLWLLVEFIKSFGAYNGCRLFFNFLRNNVTNLDVPGVKGKISLRKNTADIKTFFQVFLEREYEFDWTIEPKVIIDCGAHIGLFTIFMKNKFPHATIICVEPDKDNFANLKKNTAAYDDVFYENCGIWSQQTKLNVTDPHGLGNWGMVTEEAPDNGTIDAITIDYLLDKYNLERIDILKLDIESSEKEIFKADFDQWLSKTKVVAIELHDWMEAGCSKPFFEAINSTFESYGYFTGTENTVIINNDLEDDS